MSNKMGGKTSWCLFFCMVLNISSYAQERIVNFKPNSAYERYRYSIYNALKHLKEVSSNSVAISGYGSGIVDTTGNFSIYPTRQVDVMFRDSTDQKPIMTFHEPESLIIIPKSRKQVYEFSIKDSTASGAMVNKWTTFYINRTGTKEAKDVSFFYLLNTDRSRRNGTISSVGDKVINFNNGHEGYARITDYIINDCGSVGNYIKAFNNEKLHLKLGIKAFQKFNPSKESDIKNFIKNSWKFHYICFPNDTLKNLNMLLKDVADFGHTNSVQIRNIRSKLQQILANKSKDVIYQPDPESEKKLSLKMEQVMNGEKSIAFISHGSYYNEILFMGINLESILLPILGSTHATEYFNHYLIAQYQFKQVDMHVYHFLLNHPYPSNSAKSKAYHDYLFSVIQDQNGK